MDLWTHQSITPLLRADPGLFFFFTHTHYPVQSLRISSCFYPGTFTQQPSHYVQLGMDETATWRESSLFGLFRCCVLEDGKWLAEELPKEGAGQEWPQPQSPTGPLRQPQAPPLLQVNPLPPRTQAQQGARRPPPVHAGTERAEMGSDSALPAQSLRSPTPRRHSAPSQAPPIPVTAQASQKAKPQPGSPEHQCQPCASQPQELEARQRSSPPPLPAQRPRRLGANCFGTATPLHRQGWRREY